MRKKQGYVIVTGISHVWRMLTARRARIKELDRRLAQQETEERVANQMVNKTLER